MRPILCLLCLSFFLGSCREFRKRQDAKQLPDHVFQARIDQLRLGDGAAVGVSLSVRWAIVDAASFFQKFEDQQQYDSLILRPRSQELGAQISHQFSRIDSVFGPQRESYLHTLRSAFEGELGGGSVQIEEVILSQVHFPAAYIQAKEQIAIQAQELARIERQKTLRLAEAAANREQAEADGKVAVAQAEARGRLEQIEANIEASRRRRQLAQAETERQVSEIKAKADARRQELLSEAELNKQQQLKQLDVKKARDLELVQVEKQRALDEAAFDREVKLAKLCAENPNYASFLINKELAGHVQIAVLPSGQEGPLLGNLIGQLDKD